MHKKLIYTMAAAAMVALIVSLAATPALAQDDERKEKVIRIKKIVGEDEEAIEGHHKVVFVGEDGEATRVEGDGEGYRWFAGSHGDDMVFSMGGFEPGAFLGVGTTELTPELRRHFGVSEELGVMVSQVIDDSGAFTAGVLVGDIITGVDGEEIDSGHGLRRAIRRHDEGDAVTLEVWRDGKVQNVTAVLGETDGAFGFHGAPHPRGMIRIDCDDDRDDCDIFTSHDIEACEGKDDCEITISCDDGECTCEVDGEPTDCDDIDHVYRHHDD